MTNYTKTTDFAAKDSLPSGDSGKIIRGTEFETEFDNIATAVNSKSDANNPTFTGTVTIDGLTVNGNTVLGNAATDTVTVTADIASNLIPSADDTYNLGASGAEWNDLFIDGVANIDSLVANTADINGGTVDGVTIGGSSAGAITGTTITGTSFVTSGNMTFGDNDKALFGAGSDLEIYHNGSHSFITDTGTGSLYLRASDSLRVQSATNEEMIKADADGAVTLYNNNAAKLATTSTGIDVTGSVSADGLTVVAGNDAVAVFNRTSTGGSSVGSIAEFQRGGTLAGHVGSQSNNYFYIGQSDCNLAFSSASNIIFPRGTDGASRDGAIGLGNSSNRFQDIYLSGAVNSGSVSVVQASSATMAIQGGDGNSKNLIFKKTTGDAQQAKISAVNDDLRFVTGSGTDDAMRINSGGTVLVGKTSSASSAVGAELRQTGLIIATTSSVPSLTLNRTTSDGTVADFRKNDTTFGEVGCFSGDMIIGLGDHKLRFFDSSSSIIPCVNGGTVNDGTIDLGVSNSRFKDLRLSGTSYSNTVLVGKPTNDSLNTVGAEVQADGQIKLASDGKYPLQLNRLTSDGEIISLRKDGTTVGSIGADSGDLLIGTGITGLRFNDGSNQIIPRNTSGAQSAGVTDLGNSSSRFKDLYLSGGAYLGGIAAANKLDDYEEGTWTPVYVPSTGSFTTMTMDVLEAAYTKVGNLVTVTCYIRTDDVDVTGAGGSVSIAGLPFAAAAANAGHVGYVNGFAGEAPLEVYALSSSLLLQYRGSVTGSSASFLVTDLTDGTVANKNTIVVSATYRTTA